ncbi:peptidoglycan recognition family protein [Saccharothrix sp. HUAS TT1]|uniref:peptidoglycan recognition protein family protein n=1 Tax=unclassified Saccharothrix TaxID=2593673 RepID=UPI00345BD7A4
MDIDIIRRGQWRARHRNGFGPAPVPWEENWAHHSVTLAPNIEWIDVDGDGVEDDEAAAMRQLEQIGQDRFAGGISYTAAIPPSGRIYEGHGVDRQGAHTGGRNDIARAIVFIGNYDVHPLTEAQIDSAARLLAYWYLRGWCRWPAFDGGHQQAPNQIATACPGRYVLAAIPEINRRAALYAAGQNPKEDELDSRERNALLGLEDVFKPGGVLRIVLEEILKRLIGIQFAVGTAEMATATKDAPAGIHIGTLVADIWRRGVAEVDEGELADAMKARGMGTVDPAAVKAAMAEVLTRGTDALSDNHQNQEAPTA